MFNILPDTEFYDYDMIEDKGDILNVERAKENSHIKAFVPLEKNKQGRPLAVACSGGGGHIAAMNAILASYDQTGLSQYRPTQHTKKPQSLANLSIYSASSLNYSSSVRNITQAFGLPVIPIYSDLKPAILELEKSNQAERLYIDMLLDAYPTGYENAAIWNVLQRQDKIQELSKLIAWQSLNDQSFFQPVFDFFFNLLSTANMTGAPYTEVISTQAIGLPALCEAVKEYNKKYTPSIIINQYMTDLPTKGAVHFFSSLSTLTQSQQQQMNLHAVGLTQTVLDHFFEHGHSFNGLYTIDPKINPMVRAGFFVKNIVNEQWRAQYGLHANDKVASIMLGSQGSVDTEKYIDILRELDIKKIVVFCGANETLQRKLERKYVLLKKIELLGPQNDESIASTMACSNILIIRAGGLSVMEQMAMEHMGDQIIMIHHTDSSLYNAVIVDSASDQQANNIQSEDISEPELLKSGISWEDDNASSLIHNLSSVQVIKTCPNDAAHQLIEHLQLNENRASLHTR